MLIERAEYSLVRHEQLHVRGSGKPLLALVVVEHVTSLGHRRGHHRQLSRCRTQLALLPLQLSPERTAPQVGAAERENVVAARQRGQQQDSTDAEESGDGRVGALLFPHDSPLAKHSPVRAPTGDARFRARNALVGRCRGFDRTQQQGQASNEERDAHHAQCDRHQPGDRLGYLVAGVVVGVDSDRLRHLPPTLPGGLGALHATSAAVSRRPRRRPAAPA